MIRQLIEKTRSVRRYREHEELGEKELRGLVDLARLGGSARNGQSLKYMIVTESKLRMRIFNLLKWAGYLKDWPGPGQGERPPAYIICLLDRKLSKGPEREAYFDLGIATQNLLLGAAEKGISGCRIAAFARDIGKILYLDEQYKVLLVLALGYPAEKVVLEELKANGDIRYWRDADGVHHVPKRGLDEILLPVRKLPFE
ncbi:MAG: nitroreductase family protein [Desulfobulbaceae bacterium]|nr:nitroreductase family protein [Desulfobulbaceae bacterium]